MASAKENVNSKNKKKNLKSAGIYILKDFLALPVFTLSTKDTRREIVANFDNPVGGRIRVVAGEGRRLPTQNEADVFVWLQNYVFNQRKVGNYSYRVRVSLYEILQDMGKNCRYGRNYKYLHEAIINLLSTRIYFEWSKGYKDEWSGGSFLSDKVLNDFGNYDFLDIDIPRWLFKKTMDFKNERLKVVDNYYHFHSNFEKRLYNVGRKRVGKQMAHPGIGLQKLFKKYYLENSTYKKFVFRICKIVEDQTIPNYWLKLEHLKKRKDSYKLFFLHEKHLKKLGVDKHSLPGLPLNRRNKGADSGS